MRWDPYVLSEDRNFDDFWRDHLATRDRSMIFVLGRGFDPRALVALQRMVNVCAKPTVWLMAFDNHLEDSELRQSLTQRNRDELEVLVGKARIHELAIDIGDSAYSNATSRSTQKAIGSAGDLAAHDDVVVDISAMPRVVALTTVAKLLHDLDKQAATGGKNTNLHVVTAESVKTDLRTFGSLMDEMTNVVGFSGHLTEQTSEHVPRVWFPVLGERQKDRLQLIQSRLDPDEICPVIPFPSRNPRRGDDIINEHRVLLFEDFQVEPSNILRASEFNPFEAYKQLFGAMDRYRRALDELGGCKAFVSPLSSKLLSIGALLACYDHRSGAIEGTRLKVGIPYVETAVYSDPESSDATDYELYSMWIRGEWET
jgi:hypothetical protein